MEQEVVQTKLTDSKYAADDLCKQLRNQPESYNCIIFFAATSVNFQELQSELSQRFTKAQVVEAIKKFIPNFEHEEKGRNLDQKM